MSRAFAALSDALRRDLVEAILSRPGISVSELCDEFPVSRFVVMRHLNVLEDAELLYRERDAQTKRLHIAANELASLANGWLKDVIKRGGAGPKKGD